MSSAGSVTHWIEGLKIGDQAAAQAIWERYFEQLVRRARRKLGAGAARMADEEDIALSAMASFCRAARQGRFPQLNDRHDLWRILLRISARKVVDQVRHDRRKVRGGGKVRGESALDARGGSGGAARMAQVIGNEPSPEFAAMMAEQVARRLDAIADLEVREIVVLKMEGYTNLEIAERLGCGLSTVERRLRLVRKRWERDDRR